MESMINFGKEKNRNILRIFILYLKYCLSMSFKFRGTNINHDFSRSFDVVRRIAERKEEKKEKGKIRMRRSIDSHLLLLAIDKYDHSASNYHQRHMMEWMDMDADGSYCFHGKILHQSGRYASELFPCLTHRSFLSGCVFLKSAELSALFFPPSLLIFFRDFHVFLVSFYRFLFISRRYQPIQK